MVDGVAPPAMTQAARSAARKTGLRRWSQSDFPKHAAIERKRRRLRHTAERCLRGRRRTKARSDRFLINQVARQGKLRRSGHRLGMNRSQLARLDRGHR